MVSVLLGILLTKYLWLRYCEFRTHYEYMVHPGRNKLVPRVGWIAIVSDSMPLTSRRF